MSQVVEVNTSSESARTNNSSIGRWILAGGGFVFVGFLALTGGLCAEGLAALLIGGAAGGMWAMIARRRGWKRYITRLGGIVMLALVTLAASAVDWSLAPANVFHLAFGRPVDSSVVILKTRRFGFRDNTTLIVFKTQETTLSSLLSRANFATFREAEDLVRPPDDDLRSAAVRATYFRLNVSGGGPFQEELPFTPRLKVWRRHDEPDRTFYIVLWDPDEQKAYLFYCEY